LLPTMKGGIEPTIIQPVGEYRLGTPRTGRSPGCAPVSKLCLLAGFAGGTSYSPGYNLIPRRYP
jgi:hypothetical protein